MIDHDGGDCRACGGSGRVTRSSGGVRWSYTCSCPAGRMVALAPDAMKVVKEIVQAIAHAGRR